MALVAVLGVFKYYNFFVNTITDNQEFHLNLILPLGISFYTFMCVGYLVDVYKGRVAVGSWLTALTSLSFFPQIIAGPIGRMPQMFPQFSVERKFNYAQAMDGVAMIAYGLFKKMVVADLLALYVNFAFKNYELYSSVTCFIGMIFYTIQIYCDFSGYSDCAIGVGKLFGINLMQNFDRPYLSKSFGEFWHRWHISLSTWFRDYVYIPLGGSRCILPRVILNTWIVFLLSGLWHGAAWTFVFWGALHALYLTFGILKKRFAIFTSASTLNIIPVFIGVAFAWIFFRAGSWSVATGYIGKMFAGDFKTSLMALCAGQGPVAFVFFVVACALLVGADLVLIPRLNTTRRPLTLRAVLIVLSIAAIVFMGLPSGGEFIYAQF